MDYISTKDAAEKWGVSTRQVQRLIKEGRVPGAKKYGVSWMLPIDAPKPDDPRRIPTDDQPLNSDVCAAYPFLYIKGGDLDGAYKLCRSEEEKVLLDVWMSTFRFQIDEAKALAEKLFQETDDIRIRLGTAHALAVCAMYVSDTAMWKRMIREISEAKVPAHMETERELVLACVNVELHGKGTYPKWLETGAYSLLDSRLFPIARWIYVAILYIKWKEVDLLAVVEPLIAESRREKSDLSEIYLRLNAATAYKDLGKSAEAQEHISAAVAIAMPNGIITPFLDYRRMLASVMDGILKDQCPAEFAIIKRMSTPFMERWNELYNELWEKPIYTGLTHRELEACQLASRGMEDNEIAKRMCISKSSVKKYLNVAYNKLGVKGRSELSKLLHT